MKYSGLREKTLFGTVDKVAIAIERLRHFEPPEGYYLAFSGGKDSVVIRHLVDMSGVRYDAHYNVTTIDPPELVYFIRKFHQDVIWEHPEVPFLRMLIKKQFPPLRHQRWCCELYKESGGVDRRLITGVRWEESYRRRSKRQIFEHCLSGGYKNKNKTFVNPIIDWTARDVWEFIHANNLPYCELYDRRWTRIGCLMCPMAGPQIRMMDAWNYPRITRQFIKAFDDLCQDRKGKGKPFRNWENGEELFWWWLRDDRRPAEDPGQKMMFE